MAHPLSEGASIEDWRQGFDRNYIAACDLDSRDVTVTIKDVRACKLRSAQGEDKRPVASLQESDRCFVLNKTNCETISGLYGDKIKGWIGKRITLYPTTTQVARKTVDCIRVRNRVPPAKNGGGKIKDGGAND